MQKEIPQRPPRVPVPKQRSDAYFQSLCEGKLFGISEQLSDNRFLIEMYENTPSENLKNIFAGFNDIFSNHKP